MKAIDISVSPKTDTIAEAMIRKVLSSADKMAVLHRELSEKTTLKELEITVRAELEQHLEDGTWRMKFPGRPIIRSYFKLHLPGQNYEYGVNLLISAMAEDSFRPAGMASVLDAIDVS